MFGLAVRGPVAAELAVTLAANGRRHRRRRSSDRRRRSPGLRAVQHSPPSEFSWPATNRAARWPIAWPCAIPSDLPAPFRSTARSRGHMLRLPGLRRFASSRCSSPIAAIRRLTPSTAFARSWRLFHAAGHVRDAAAISLRRRADDADAQRPGLLADGAGHRRRATAERARPGRKRRASGTKRGDFLRRDANFAILRSDTAPALPVLPRGPRHLRRAAAVLRY